MPSIVAQPQEQRRGRTVSERGTSNFHGAVRAPLTTSHHNFHPAKFPVAPPPIVQSVHYKTPTAHTTRPQPNSFEAARSSGNLQNPAGAETSKRHENTAAAEWRAETAFLPLLLPRCSTSAGLRRQSGRTDATYRSSASRMAGSAILRFVRFVDYYIFSYEWFSLCKRITK